MKISARAVKIITVCAAASLGLQAATAQTQIRPVTAVQTLETRTDIDVVYTPIRNEVVTRLPVGDQVVAPVDTFKLQIMNGINSGIAQGKITEQEANRLYAMIDTVALQEAQFKIAGLTDAGINNLMRKYHMIDQHLNELSNNTDSNDFMPSIEGRRDRLARRILWNMAAANLTPAEGEQLLAALNNITDNYATMRATGGTLSADEFESIHKDMYKLTHKLSDRVGALIARVVPETNVQRSEYLKKIQQGLATKTLSPEEGARLLSQYNRLVLLETSIATENGVRSSDMKQLADEINNLNFILTRELRDRTVAGQNTRL